MEILREKECQFCGKNFSVHKKRYPSWQKIEDARIFCNTTCAVHFGRDRSWQDSDKKELWLKNIKIAMNRPDVKLKRIQALQSEKSPWWKDNDATYNSKHRWIQRHWKKSGRCDFCRKIPKKRKGSLTGTEWSNITGKYDRNDRNDWQELCMSCHRLYDKAQRLKKI